MGFQVVEVRAGAVDLGCDIVAGAMGKILAKARRADHHAGGIVSLITADGAVGGKCLFNGVNGRVAGVADRLEDKLLARGSVRGQRRQSM